LNGTVLALFALIPAQAALAGEAPTFSADIVPILRSRCAICHLTGVEAGNMSLVPDAAYASLVSVKSPTTGLVRVEPGNPESSYLIMKLEGTHLSKGGSGARMPFGAEPLSAADVKLIRDWIAAGAPKN
jgi:hypothetical protein